MMSKRNIINAEAESEEGPHWLTTFNDLMTLLMVFFVLLFAMSSLDIEKMKNFKFLLQTGLGILENGKMISITVKEQQSNSDMSTQNEEAIQTSITSDMIPSDMIRDAIKDLDSDPGIRATYTEKGVHITLDNSILFKNGIADVNPECLPVLDKIAAVIGKISNPIRVEGHTDNVPIYNRRFPSNWELSTARAVNVVKYFAEVGKISPKRLSAVGYGESKPLCPNDTPDNRAKNRRVEIILAKEEER